MTDKCELCNGTKVDAVFGGRCEWCDETGKAGGLTPLPNGPLAMLSAMVDAVNHGVGFMRISSEGVEHVPLTDVMVNLKPFRSLPYGTKFRYQGTQDVWVRTQHNVVAEWPGRLRTPTNEPIQSLCCFCHLEGDEDGNTLDTLVEVVDRASELTALREELAKEKLRYACDVDSADEETSALREIIRDLKDWRECSQSSAAFASILERAELVIPAPGPLRKSLTAAEQRNSELVTLLHSATVDYACCLEAGYDRITWLGGDCDSVEKMLADNPNYARYKAAMTKPTESGASE